MRVLVTGATGLIGTPAVRALLAHGHEVRLLARHADADAMRWPERVDSWKGDITRAETLAGAADGCDAVLHIAGIGSEKPPESTFENVNVRGTQNLLAEATRAGVRRFVFVSSLKADTGTSGYHGSKRRAEGLVRAWNGQWCIVRPGNVYGPGDDVLSRLLKMVRSLPAIPVIDKGDQPFQPIWADDLGEALARLVEREDIACCELAVAGGDVTTMQQALDELCSITGRTPARVPVPSVVARAGAKIAEAVGLQSPVSEDQLIMLREHNVLAPNEPNALAQLGVKPTPFAEGLRKLAEALPEQVIDAGAPVWRREHYADIQDSGRTPEQVFALAREQFATLMPVTVRLRDDTEIEPGATLTMSLPLRGEVQVRIEELTERSMTCVTLEGHPLSGAIRFLAEERGDAVRFFVQTWDQAATPADDVLMRAGGGAMKAATWRAFVERVVVASGGRAPAGVQESEEQLPREQAERIEEWVQRLIVARQREEEEDQPPGAW